MSNRFLPCVLTFCGALTLAVASADEPSEEAPAKTPVETHQIVESDGYRLSVPADWEVLEEEKTVITVRAPRTSDEDEFHENVRLLLYDVGKKYSVEQVVRRQKSDLERFKLIGEGEAENPTMPMRWMAVTPKTPRDAGDRLVKIDFIATRGTKLVVLIAMAEIDDWRQHLPQFKAIAKSLRFTDQ